jgi:NADP-dependent 3-hydroxy acid dehydrogenase YdfG
MPDGAGRVAVVTGSSSGIGAATLRALAGAGFTVVGGARRVDEAEQVAREVGATAMALDVTKLDSIRDFTAAVERQHGRIDLLVNNAGLAAGLDPVESGSDDDWVAMMDTNVLGILRMTRACLPLIRKAPYGHIVNLGSIASFEVYRGGAGYTASKHAERAITRTLRLELNGEPIRVSEISPGMTETEFSLVRFKGDKNAASTVYQGVEPLTGADIAECILFAVTRPKHVDIDEMVIRPIAQAASFMVSRKT